MTPSGSTSISVRMTVPCPRIPRRIGPTVLPLPYRFRETFSDAGPCPGPGLQCFYCWKVFILLRGFPLQSFRGCEGCYLSPSYALFDSGLPCWNGCSGALGNHARAQTSPRRSFDVNSWADARGLDISLVLGHRFEVQEGAARLG